MRQYEPTDAERAALTNGRSRVATRRRRNTATPQQPPNPIDAGMDDAHRRSDTPRDCHHTAGRTTNRCHVVIDRAHRAHIPRHHRSRRGLFPVFFITRPGRCNRNQPHRVRNPSLRSSRGLAGTRRTETTSHHRRICVIVLGFTMTKRHAIHAEVRRIKN